MMRSVGESFWTESPAPTESIPPESWEGVVGDITAQGHWATCSLKFLFCCRDKYSDKIDLRGKDLEAASMWYSQHRSREDRARLCRCLPYSLRLSKEWCRSQWAGRSR